MTTATIPRAIAKGPNPDAEFIRLDGREFWTTGARVIEFIETMCVFSNGRWTGDPVTLEPWQKRLLYELFEIDPATGCRRFRRALIGTSRKSGKTELGAWLALYFFLADGERSAEVYCAASSEDQADRVFMAARRMCEGGNPLSEMVVVPGGEQAGYLTSVSDPYSWFKRLTSKGKTKHGLNIHAVILDEVHAWGVGEQEELWAALTTGMAAREQPMMLMITTAGTDLEESRCGGLYEMGMAMERGEVEDDGFFFRWWQAPDGCDYRDPAMWKLANPNYGVTVTEQFLLGELAGTNMADGKRKGAITESEFRRLYLNQWVDFAEAPWIAKEQLAECRVPKFELRLGEATWVGVDLSRSEDSTGVGYAQQWTGSERPCRHRGPEPCLYFEARSWERPRQPDGKLELGWRVPLDDVRQYLRDLSTRYNVLTNVFDPYGSQLMLLDLEADGLKCELMFQQGQRRAAAASGLYDLIIQGRFHYWQDDVERHLLNATVKATGDDGYYLQKRRKGKVMDIAQAASQVVYGTMHERVAASKAPNLWTWDD